MAGGEFQHSLFGCFDNCGVCIISYIVPCYAHGRIAEKVGEPCLLCGITQIIPLANFFFRAQIRGKVRDDKGIDGGFIGDLIMGCCCYCCTIVQEAQEMQAIGSMSMARQ